MAICARYRDKCDCADTLIIARHRHPCITRCFAQPVFHHSSSTRGVRVGETASSVSCQSSPSSLTLTSRRFSTESQLCTGGNNIYLVESPPEYCGPDTYHLSRVTSLRLRRLARRQLKLDFNLPRVAPRCEKRATCCMMYRGTERETISEMRI